MDKSFFTKGTKRLVNPIDVGTIHFIQYFNRFVPKFIQEKMVQSSGKKTPQMGFIVEPYSFYLFYEITNLSLAQTFLPKGFRLIRTSIFGDDDPKYYCIIGCFNAHTSAFWGSRIEFYIIAENNVTGLLSWIIVDYDTNTITYDPKNGLSDPNCDSLVITVDYNGCLWVDSVNQLGRKLSFSSAITNGTMVSLNHRLWIEGNLSIAYGTNKTNTDAGLFSLVFDSEEFNYALKLPLENLKLHQNDWFPELTQSQPSHILCFPYAQHFLSDSPGHSSSIKDLDTLNHAMLTTNFNKIKPFSTTSFKLSFILGGLISTILNIVLLILIFS